MATALQTYWDPENLFQIGDYGMSGDVQCAGRARTKNNARCRWNIRGIERNQIYELVARLSQKAPDEVQASDLWPLAQKCLCQDYHSNQVGEVVQRWQELVRRAAQNYSNASSRQNTPERESPSSSMSSPQRSIELGQPSAAAAELSRLVREKSASLVQKNFETTQQELWKSHQECRNLKEEIESLKKETQKATDGYLAQVSDMRALVDARNNELAAARDEIKTRDGRIQDMADQISRAATTAEQIEETVAEFRLLRDRAVKERDLMKSIVAQKDGELKSGGSRLESLQHDNERLHAENVDLYSKIDALQTNFETAESERSKLTAELATMAVALEQSKAKDQGTLEKNSLLKKEIQDLRDRLVHMEKDASMHQTVHVAAFPESPMKQLKKVRSHRGCGLGISRFWRR
ncbi:hypothetical protein NKR23_g1171 [Pleurostoma richardsiae]|uniref:Uncharacterized protein n=1 Tax=Pleurostoma richardsiae TaxID=41990 RepID=A0AA38VWZ4_9PEZI|nr:hypothetical protein NKR23_g1171 [Pleurostoma richardsiae]